jgi:adenylate cyclase
MAGSRPVTSYEVHVMHGSRWELHANYPDNKKDIAMRDGKSLDKISTIEAVKVVRSVYNSEKNVSTEKNIFESESLKKKEPKRQSPPPPEPKPAAKTAAKPPAKKAKKKKTVASKASMDPKAGLTRADYDDAPRASRFGIVTKLILITLFSITIGALLTSMAGVWLRDSAISSNLQANILFGVFVGSFLLSAISMAITFLAKDNLGASASGLPPQPVAAAPIKPLSNEAIEEYMPAEEEPKPKDEEGEEEADDISLEEALAQGGVEEGDDYKEQDVEKSLFTEEQKALMAGFLDKGLAKAGIHRKEMDNFNKFGIDLFLAGACEALSQKHNLDTQTMTQVLSDSVQAMGFEKSQAESFSDKYQDYLLSDSRYMQMFQAGRNAMNTYLADEVGGVKMIADAIKDWNKPKDKEESTGPVTVLFTDIAGSTAMTQTLGDAGAQKAVRLHNRIVRDALSKCNGREIKHTGDGIMASFSITSNGVAAAIKIQTDVASHNATNPDLPLHLKVGINAGEPISEDDDLFGTTVQLAARIVDKTAKDQILVSDAVRGICAGKNYRFVTREAFQMKGFDTPITLHEAIWREDTPGEKEKAAQDKATQEKVEQEKAAQEKKAAAEKKAAEEKAAKEKAAQESTATASPQEAPPQNAAANDAATATAPAAATPAPAATTPPPESTPTPTPPPAQPQVTPSAATPTPTASGAPAATPVAPATSTPAAPNAASTPEETK